VLAKFDRNAWMLEIKFLEFGSLAGFEGQKRLSIKGFNPVKNIFKKMAKIPPGELQEFNVMVKG
jgi:hypothetical protein